MAGRAGRRVLLVRAQLGAAILEVLFLSPRNEHDSVWRLAPDLDLRMIRPHVAAPARVGDARHGDALHMLAMTLGTIPDRAVVVRRPNLVAGLAAHRQRAAPLEHGQGVRRAIDRLRVVLAGLGELRGGEVLVPAHRSPGGDGMSASLELGVLALVAIGAGACGHEPCDLKPLVLELLRLVSRLVAVEASDPGQSMAAVLPLTDDSGGLLAVALDALAGALHLLGGGALYLAARPARLDEHRCANHHDGARDRDDRDAVPHVFSPCRQYGASSG